MGVVCFSHNLESYCKISRFGRDVRTQDQIQQNKKQGRNVWKLLIWVIMRKELVVEGGQFFYLKGRGD